MNISFFANILGACSLGAFAIAVLPTLGSIFKSLSRRRRQIRQIARYSLLICVCLGLSHGLLMTQQHNIDFYDLGTYWTYAVGLFAFNLLVFIAFMYGELKSDGHKLDYFCYGALTLLVCHVGQQFVF
ncbi:MAG: hypothetical protein AAFQ41_09745 [Cyanobacteria bacterium J06623_7]